MQHFSTILIANIVTVRLNETELVVLLFINTPFCENPNKDKLHVSFLQLHEQARIGVQNVNKNQI